MDILDRIPISFDVFIRSVIAKFAKNNNLPATAVSEMRCAKLCQVLFDELGGSEVAMEYIHSVLGRMPGKMRARVKISENLADFMSHRIYPPLVRRYGLEPEDLFINWTFDCLEDVSTLERLNLGASVKCEHHDKWVKEQFEKTRKAFEDELNPSKEPAVETGHDPTENTAGITTETGKESPGELDSLMTL